MNLANLDDRMRELKVPAVSVAVFHDGQLEWTKAWGFADSKRSGRSTRYAASRRHRSASPWRLSRRWRWFHAGDCTRRDVNKPLKSWKVPDNQFTTTEKVTLRRLLTHSAGTTVSGFRGYAMREDVPTLLQVLNGVKPANSARDRRRHSRRLALALFRRWHSRSCSR